MKNLLTIAEAAEALNLKISTVRAWLAKGKFPRVNCGRAVRIPAESVVKFIERNTIPAREDQLGPEPIGVVEYAGRDM